MRVEKPKRTAKKATAATSNMGFEAKLWAAAAALGTRINDSGRHPRTQGRGRLRSGTAIGVAF